MRIGVDAFNLSADRRGMGRLVRHNLASLARLGEAQIVLVTKDHKHVQALRDEFALDTIVSGGLENARLDAVWYPWNGIRFRPYAKSIVTINDPFAFTYPHRSLIARLREQSPIRKAIREADLILTISSWGAKELQRLFGVAEDRLRVSTPAIDAFWHPVNVGASEPYMLFVAGPDARKNAPLLFAAFDRAFGQMQSPRLVVAGTLSDDDEQRFSKMSASRVRLRPSDPELRELYAGAQAVLVPSLAEGYGLPAVEAMACGAPVIASDRTALPEACGGAALLVSPTDLEAWGQTMRRLAEDGELRRALRERGLERVARIDPDGPATTLLESVRRLRATAR
jgi:glycosyltransferase involved in cell wall biosynthesis